MREARANTSIKSFVNSRATLASATVAAVGSVAWYAHLYGTLPFIGEVHANSPSEEGLHPPQYPWSHSGVLDSFDHARYVLLRVCYPERSFTYHFAAFVEDTRSTARSVLLATP